MKAANRERLALAILSAVYVIWAGLFIYRNSYIAIDGGRYFGLFDDAMISMRYAWNFAHGQGLVWNAGEPVEGYSNLLMTLLMSLASLLLDKRLAVLAVQLAGIPTILGVAWLARSLAHRVEADNAMRRQVGIAVFVSALAYFPISYWTLMGMETGLLTVLLLACAWFGLKWLEGADGSDLARMAWAAGLAFLTRNDSLILSGTIIAVVIVTRWRRHRDLGAVGSLVRAGAIVALVVLAQIVFRCVMYGELLPNTFILKLTRYPLQVRLIDGTRFVLEFLGQSWLLFLLAAAALARGLRAPRVLMASLIVGVLAYQVYVGGDPWNTWRMLAPGMPALFILAAAGAAELARLVPARASSSLRSLAPLGAAALALLLADLPFLADMSVRGPTSAAIANRTNTNTALAIDALTQPDASVGVIWAGTLPYYVDRYAIDYLGKSDPYIAGLEADVSGSSGWGGQISIPGHNKYDLEYSIVKRRPTYSQAFSWGYATVRPYFVENYVRVEYHGVAGTKTIFLLKDSPLVCWEACRDSYKIIPWPK